MNAIKEINRINQRELELGLAGKGSWHDEYKDSAYVFIGGLSYDLTEGDVLTILSQFGEIVDINLPRDKATGKTKGFGFVMYEDQRSTVLAVDNMNGAQVLGRTIRVDHCRKYNKPGEKSKEGEHVAPEEPTYNAMPPILDGSDDSESEESDDEPDNLDDEDPMAAFIRAEKKKEKIKAKGLTDGKKRKHDGESKEEKRARKEAKRAKKAEKEARKGIKRERDGSERRGGPSLEMKEKEKARAREREERGGSGKGDRMDKASRIGRGDVLDRKSLDRERPRDEMHGDRRPADLQPKERRPDDGRPSDDRRDVRRERDEPSSDYRRERHGERSPRTDRDGRERREGSKIERADLNGRDDGRTRTSGERNGDANDLRYDQRDVRRDIRYREDDDRASARFHDGRRDQRSYRDDRDRDRR